MKSRITTVIGRVDIHPGRVFLFSYPHLGFDDDILLIMRKIVDPLEKKELGYRAAVTCGSFFLCHVYDTSSACASLLDFTPEEIMDHTGKLLAG